MKNKDEFIEKVIDLSNKIHQQTSNQKYAYIPIQPKIMATKKNRLTCHHCGKEFKLNEQTASIANSKICEVNNDNLYFNYTYPDTSLIFHLDCFRLLCGEGYYSIIMEQLGKRFIP